MMEPADLMTHSIVFKLEEVFDTNDGAGGPPGPLAQSFLSKKDDARLFPNPPLRVCRYDCPPPPFHHIPHFI